MRHILPSFLLSQTLMSWSLLLLSLVCHRIHTHCNPKMNIPISLPKSTVTNLSPSLTLHNITPYTQHKNNNKTFPVQFTHIATCSFISIPLIFLTFKFEHKIISITFLLTLKITFLFLYNKNRNTNNSSPLFSNFNFLILVPTFNYTFTFSCFCFSISIPPQINTTMTAAQGMQLTRPPPLDDHPVDGIPVSEVPSSDIPSLPTVAFDRSNCSGRTTVSPTSVIAFEDESNGVSESSCELSTKHSRESSIMRNSNGEKESLDWCSALSSDYASSRVSFSKNNNEPISTSNVDSDSENDDCKPGEPVKRDSIRKGKKGSCYRCFKGSRLTEKEVCLVCDAKYCGNCVLRAMGSMPEGRKCVGCIGYPINESKRGSLGRCSRLLKRLLNRLEVRQVMKAERFCEVNQLPPNCVCVNGNPLSFEELVTLQNCSNPPKKLKPGNYWYDKVSGFWGKEGQKPCSIISPHLNVGGPIKQDASNGNTQVFINGREITKVELRMLQLAGVQCAGNPHFWVNEDGSYQEEGQKNTRGYIWGKAGTKLVCAFLSLPVPSRYSTSCGFLSSNVVARTVPDYTDHGVVHKLLLVGYSGSGTSTIFKQAKILYKSTPFSEKERGNIKLTIQTNVYAYLGILLEGRERFEEESLGNLKKNQSLLYTTGTSPKHGNKTVYSIGTRLKAFSDWLLKTMVSGKLDAIFPAATREYTPLIEELWNDSAIKATYERRNEIEMLPSVASYFLERAIQILRTDYEPSDIDILYAEGVTSSNGLASVEFSFPQSAPVEAGDTDDLHDSLARYELITIHARGLGDNCKWLEMFEDVGLVIFCVSLSDYNQFSTDGNSCLTNKMILSRKLFETIVTHPTFEQMDFLLLLNKMDEFEEKIEHIPLTQCDWFSDFHPIISHNRPGSNNNINNNPSLSQLASHYIAVKFKRLYSSLTGQNLYVSLVKGLEPDSVDASLKYGKEILKWNEEKPNFSLSDDSMHSIEASSFSH